MAVELAARGADFVVVGGTARWLRGATRWPRDLDIAVAEDRSHTLVRALADLGVDLSIGRLHRCGTVRVDTAWCELDVFVAARAPAVGGLLVDGCELAVADV